MKKLLSALLVLFSVSSVFAQEISEKQEISLFDISFFEAGLDLAVVEGVDAQIRDVFINLGRFDIIGMTFRLDAVDVNDFINRIREIKESTVQYPEDVRFGRASFTEEDYNRLVGGFIVVIPQITNYIVDRQADGDYEAIVDTSFSFVNVEDMTTFAAFNISTSAIDDNRDIATKEAMDKIADELSFQVRSIPEFQIKSGILDVQGSEVTIEFGRNMGLVPGDEYLIKNISTTSIGRSFEEEVGLIIIKDVQADYSLAHVIYGDATIGAAVHEYPRFGVDFDITAALGTFFANDSASNYISLALSGVASRGFFDIRPFGQLEIPIVGAGFIFLPVTLSGGVQKDLYLDRLMVSPYAGLSLGTVVPLWKIDDFIEDPASSFEEFVTHVGARVGAKLNLLIGNDMRIGGFVQGSAMLGLLSETVINGFVSAFDFISAEDVLFYYSYAALDFGIEFVYKY